MLYTGGYALEAVERRSSDHFCIFSIFMNLVTGQNVLTKESIYFVILDYIDACDSIVHFLDFSNTSTQFGQSEQI